MNPYKQLAVILCLVLVITMGCIPCQAQAVVNGKNLNEEKDLEYIQPIYLSGQIDDGTGILN